MRSMWTATSRRGRGGRDGAAVSTRNAPMNRVYTQANAINVDSNVPAGTGETASALRSRPQITQGCRPVSARYQPPRVANTPEGVIATNARRNQRVVYSRPRQ